MISYETIMNKLSTGYPQVIHGIPSSYPQAGNCPFWTLDGTDGIKRNFFGVYINQGLTSVKIPFRSVLFRFFRFGGKAEGTERNGTHS